MYLPPGSLLGTVTAPPVGLLGCCVFVAVTLHAQTATPSVRTVLSTRNSAGGPGSLTLRMDSNSATPLGPMVSYADCERQRWYGSAYGPTGPPFDLPSVWAFRPVAGACAGDRRQYAPKGADVELKHLPHSDARATVPDTVVIPGASIPAAYRNELQLGGWRGAASDTDSGGEHGNCTVHEVVVYNGPLSDADMVGVYASLVRRWQVA